jgi:DNA-binding transcriptional LysR family regulator
MASRSLDFRLLKIFDAIYGTGSLTQAARRLGLSQPTLSLALGQLRGHFKDPLFVRASNRMVPTPLADRLVRSVREALQLLDSALGTQLVFTPNDSDRTFRICMTDISQIVLLPAMLNRLCEIAPAVRVDVINISELTPKMLENGEAELAIGFMPQLDAGYYQQKLFWQDFVCLVRAGHPRIGTRLTLRQFREEAHVQVVASGTGYAFADKLLEQRGIERRITLRVPNFLGVASIISSTDLIATLPRGLGESFAHRHKVRVLPIPAKLPNYAVKQHWHERYHQDPANQWLRGVVVELFRNGPPRQTL